MSQPVVGPSPAWGAVPVVPIVLAFATGIGLATALGFQPPLYWLLTALALGATVAGLVLKPSPLRSRALFTSGLLLMLALCLGAWRSNANYLPGSSNFFVDNYATGDLLAGTVSSVRPGEKRMRAEVRLTHLLRDSTGNLSVSGNLLVYLLPDEKTAELRAGDGIVLSGNFGELRRPLNPFTPDLRGYWSGRGVYNEMFLRTDDEWRRTPGSGAGITARAEDWRRAWFKTFQRYLKGDQLAVAAALVLGQRDGLSKEIRSAYTDTGAVHVLAVSGLHVGIIFLILNFLLTRLRLDRVKYGRLLVALITAAGVWAFALVSGFSPSVQRAALMFSVLAVGRISSRRGDIFNTLGAAALIMLWWNPAQLFQVGFQLSFSAIVGIVLFTSYLERLWELPTVIVRKAWSAMAASTGAQLGTLPLSLYHFGQFPTYFLLSGTVVILSAFAIMCLGLLHGLVAGVGGDTLLADVTGWLLGTTVFVQNAFIYFFQGLPGGLLKVPVFPWYLAVLLAVAVGLLAAFARWRTTWTGIAGILLFCVLLFWARTLVQGEVEKAGTIVYHVSRGTLLDVPSAGGPAYAFGTEPTVNNLVWTAGPNRERRGYERLMTLPFSHRDTVLSPNLSWKSPYLTTPSDRFLILDGENKSAPVPDFTAVTKILTTKILITNGFKPAGLPELPADDPPLVIVDGSNRYYQYAQWRELAIERGFTVWITAEDGAWVAD